MLILSLNAVFAFLAFTFSRGALRRAVTFLRIGWDAVHEQVQQPDYRQNIERRRVISEGGRFLIGGLLWLVTGVGAIGFGLYFTLQIIDLYR